MPVGVDATDTDFNTVNQTGGSKTVTLEVSQIPSHRHGAINYAIGYSGGSQSSFSTVLAGSTGGDGRPAVRNTGGGEAHDNLSPYITVYYWRRSA